MSVYFDRHSFPIQEKGYYPLILDKKHIDMMKENNLVLTFLHTDRQYSIRCGGDTNECD